MRGRGREILPWYVRVHNKVECLNWQNNFSKYLYTLDSSPLKGTHTQLTNNNPIQWPSLDCSAQYYTDNDMNIHVYHTHNVMYMHLHPTKRTIYNLSEHVHRHIHLYTYVPSITGTVQLMHAHKQSTYRTSFWCGPQAWMESMVIKVYLNHLVTQLCTASI